MAIRSLFLLFVCLLAHQTHGQEESREPIIVPSITFSKPPGLVSEPISLQLSCSAADAILWYTLDGSLPAPLLGTRYKEPITIEKGTLVRVVAAVDDNPVASASAGYLFMDAEVRAFSSNLPVVVVDSFGIPIDREDFEDSRGPLRQVYGVFVDRQPDTGRTTITARPDFAGRAGMRVRGQSSTHFPKKQYTFETWDEKDEDKPVEILHFPKESDWILHAPYSDKTLMRNVLAYQWFREMGHYAARTQFVELFYNANGDDVTMEDYVGVYVFMEKIKRDRNRVDVAKLENTMTQEPEISGGYIIKKDKGTFRDVHFQSTQWHEFGFVEPDEPTPNQIQYMSEYVRDFERSLESEVFAHPDFGYSKYIDVRSFMDVHAHVEICRNIDGFRLSTYYYKDREEKLTMGPVWDYNLSLGNAEMRDGYEPEGWYHDSLWEREYTYFKRLFDDAAFELRYWDRYYALRETVFEDAKLEKQINAFRDDLAEAQARNFERWPILGSVIWPNPPSARNLLTHEAEVDWMKDWLKRRLAWMDRQFTPPPSASEAGEKITLALPAYGVPPAAEILYTVDGTDPWTPHGKPSKSAKIYRHPIASIGTPLTIAARVYGSEGWGALRKKTITPDSHSAQSSNKPHALSRWWIILSAVILLAMITGASFQKLVRN